MPKWKKKSNRSSLALCGFTLGQPQTFIKLWGNTPEVDAAPSQRPACHRWRMTCFERPRWMCELLCCSCRAVVSVCSARLWKQTTSVCICWTPHPPKAVSSAAVRGGAGRGVSHMHNACSEAVTLMLENNVLIIVQIWLAVVALRLHHVREAPEFMHERFDAGTRREEPCSILLRR